MADVDDVRLLISDLDTPSIFTDPEIARFIALRGDVRLAAATALRVMAGNIAQVQGKTKLLDLSLDGPAAAKALRDLADNYEREVDEAGSIDFAEPGGT